MDWGSVLLHLEDIVNTVIDCVLPPRKTTRRTKRHTVRTIPLHTASHHLLGVEITTLLDYQNPVVRDLVQSLKNSKYLQMHYQDL